jgi:hypothetical protein
MSKRSISAAIVAAVALSLSPGIAHARLANAPQTKFPQVNGAVHTVDKLGGTLYLGGSFTRVTDSKGRTYARRGAAAVSASTGRVLKWNPRVAGEVRDIEATRQGVYLAGDFSRVRSSSRDNLARVDRRRGAVNRKFDVRTDGAVDTLALTRSRIYFGGEFTEVGTTARSNAAAVRRSGSFRLTPWAPQVRNGAVHELVRGGDDVYIAGQFRELNGSTGHRFLALVDGRRGATVNRFDPAVSHVVYDIDVTASRVYGAMGGPGGAVLALSRTTGAQQWTRRFDGDAQAVEAMGGEVLVGGHFTWACENGYQAARPCVGGDSTFRQRGASFNPSTGRLTSWNPGANSPVGVLELAPIGRGRLAVGGDFTNPRDRFAVFASVR